MPSCGSGPADSTSFPSFTQLVPIFVVIWWSGGPPPPHHPVCAPAAESIPGSIQACYYDMTLMILNTCLTTSDTPPPPPPCVSASSPSLPSAHPQRSAPASIQGVSEVRHRPADRLMNHPSVRGCDAVMRQAKQEVTLQSW